MHGVVLVLWRVGAIATTTCKQNRKLGNVGKFSFALNFDCVDCIKRRKAENFHCILNEYTSYLLIQRNKNTI